MKPNVNSLERAFELARAGTFESVDDIKGQLHQEGYSSKSIVGEHLSAQLRDLIRLSHREGVADPEKLRGDFTYRPNRRHRPRREYPPMTRRSDASTSIET